MTSLASTIDYLQLCLGEGFQNLTFQDLSHYLPLNFQKMIAQIDEHYEALVAQGVDANYIKGFRQSLSDRVGAALAGNFAWCGFAMSKGPALDQTELRPVLDGRHLHTLTPVQLTAESLGELGEIYDYAIAESEQPEVARVPWPHNGTHPMESGRGLPPLSQADMTMEWDAYRLNASNSVLNETYPALAYKDDKAGYFAEWFNQHIDSAQKFHCPGERLLFLLAPPIDNPTAQDFTAFVSSGEHGVVIKPGVWHTNPIPIDANSVSLQTTQSSLNATRDLFLSAERNQWINVPIDL